MNFTYEIKQKYPSLPFVDVETVLKKAENVGVPVYKVREVSPVAIIPQKIFDLLQIGLRRNLELAASFINTFNSELFTPLFVIARAVLETGCLVYEIGSRVDQISKQNDKTSLSDFDENVNKALFGVKSNLWGGDPQKCSAFNVLSIIDRLKKQAPELRNLYDALSEYAHPNYHGMLAVYAEFNEGTYENHYIDRPFNQESRILEIPLKAFAAGMQQTTESIDLLNENLTVLIKLCEEVIYDKGTWPKNIPYPRS